MRITQIRILKMWETCQRTTFFVELTTEEGFTITPEAFATGSVYTDFEGLSLEEARDRALISADTWADLLKLEVEPYVEDGRVVEPSMTMRTYTIQRELADRKVARARAAAK